ncbi:ATP-dependent dethiobiotin synthetase BioD [bacterium]|nr:ATP-dependent dethiobiotin synthetase BioD [bacterium]
MSVYAVVGIDTDIGKTVVTGLIARTLLQNGVNVITQKMAQTGCVGVAEDIIEHRRIMGVSLFDDDKSGDTCPFVFPVPSSPHLAAELAGGLFDSAILTAATERLNRKFDTVLLEGVGGLFVPLTRELLLIDYLKEMQYPTIVVTSSRLGSINHTLLTLEALISRNIPIAGIVYNRFSDALPKIADDTRNIIAEYLEKHNIPNRIIDIGEIREPFDESLDFSDFF